MAEGKAVPAIFQTGSKVYHRGGNIFPLQPDFPVQNTYLLQLGVGFLEAHDFGAVDRCAEVSTIKNLFRAYGWP